MLDKLLIKRGYDVYLDKKNSRLFASQKMIVLSNL